MPPKLDEDRVAHLAKLAAAIDGARPGEWEDKLEMFNRLAGTAFGFKDFQGIYGGEDHSTWVRRVLNKRQIRSVPDVTRDELVELVRRAATVGEEAEAYMLVFDANVPRPKASNLIFYPPDYDARTNTWDGGRQICEYDPTPEQIVEWALNHRA